MSEEGTTRRLAAILAADVVDYSRRMHEDEAGTVAAWQAARQDAIDPTLEVHNGRVVKRTGDGFLAEFTTVEEAVRCAVAIQEALKANPLDFRMGLNLGDITDDGDDIHGDGVNIAARLEGLAEPGGILISASVYDQVHNKLDLGYQDLGEQQVKNIATPVQAYRIDTSATPVPPPPTVEPVRSRGPVLASLVAIAVLGAGVLIWQPWTSTEKAQAPAPQTPPPEQVAKKTPGPKPAIAVLPFANISGDKEQEYFSDGMTEDLITDLSKLSELKVISRSATSGYKGREIDVREVGTALGVRYVVEGSVRKAGEKVRINAQLTDTTTGSHLWAERYDGDLKDIFALQDRVLKKLVGSLSLALTEKERRRLASRGTKSIAAHDLYLKGLYEESKFNRAANAAAVGLYEQALSIDPDYPLPYARLSNILQLNTRNGWSDDIPGDLKKAVELAEKAVALDGQNPSLHWSLGRAVARIREPGAVKRGIASLERAIELDPDFADAYAFLGVLYTGDGRAVDGVRSVETAMRLNPRHPFWYLFMRAMARFMLEDYVQAAADLERAAERSPTAQFLRWWLAATYAQLDRSDDAEWQIEELTSMGFTGNIRTITETQPIQHPPYLDRYRKALLKAGIQGVKATEPEKAVTTGKPSIAVLPFVNMSGDAGQDYFSDGMTEDLITDLSKISGLTLIARNSTFSYKGKSVDVRVVAKDLGVRYVLEGSVRKAGNRVRINAQLIDGETGNHLWADRYDGILEDVFGLQDKVTAKIVTTLAVQLTAGEEQRIAEKETASTEAYDTFLKGWEQYQRQRPESFRRAIGLFEQAVKQDPTYSRAYAALAATYWQVWKRWWFAKVGLPNQHDVRFKAEEYLAKALKEPTPLAHQVSVSMSAQQGRHDEAIAEGERAIALDPNDAEGYVALAGALNLAGRPKEALPLIERAMRLNPHYPTSYLYELGLARFGHDEFEPAAAALEKAVAINPEDRWSSRVLIAALGHLDRKQQAEKLMENAERNWRGFDPLSVRSVSFWYPFRQAADAERLAEGLRRAGVPD